MVQSCRNTCVHIQETEREKEKKQCIMVRAWSLMTVTEEKVRETSSDKVAQNS